MKVGQRTNGGTAPLLEVTDLKKHYPVRKGMFSRTVGQVLAVDGISFTINAGETLGLVGESGCGKSTAGKAILKLIEPTSGTVRVRGERIDQLSRAEMRPYRRELQVVFQDPYSSLNPRMNVGDIVGEPLRNYEIASGVDLAGRVAVLFEKVGLRGEAMQRYPHEFSGGQRQRIAIARALAANPSVIVLDEPLASLDASAQAQLANLLKRLSRELEVGLLLISHDLAIVRHVADEVSVMYLGRMVETAPTLPLWEHPAHPYSEALIAAVPRADGGGVLPDSLPGEVPDPSHPPTGCRFHPRCPYAFDRCTVEEPPLLELSGGRASACWLQTEGRAPAPLPNLVGTESVE